MRSRWLDIGQGLFLGCLLTEIDSNKLGQYRIYCTGECVVPENIHTPTMEGIGNSEGEGGGSKTQEIPEGRGAV